MWHRVVSCSGVGAFAHRTSHKDNWLIATHACLNEVDFSQNQNQNHHVTSPRRRLIFGMSSYTAPDVWPTHGEKVIHVVANSIEPAQASHPNTNASRDRCPFYSSTASARRRDMCLGLCVGSGQKRQCVNNILGMVEAGNVGPLATADLLYRLYVRTDELRKHSTQVQRHLYLWQDECTHLKRSLDFLGHTNRCVACHFEVDNDDIIPGSQVFVINEVDDKGRFIEQPTDERGRMRCAQCRHPIHGREPCSVALDPSDHLTRTCQRCSDARQFAVRGRNMYAIATHTITPTQRLRAEMDSSEASRDTGSEVKPLGAWDTDADKRLYE